MKENFRNIFEGILHQCKNPHFCLFFVRGLLMDDGKSHKAQHHSQRWVSFGMYSTQEVVLERQIGQFSVDLLSFL